ncbi:MAG: Na+/H+ antiporter NhaC family protein, partial [Lachnospiraceae bacterium]|nr:Na+/H+ antiporter NhaC family protein [Lachnospiraceae bacterium]
MNLEMIEAGWLSLLPPLIAITLALISKEVYSSLFLGVLTGMLVYCVSTGGNVLQAVTYAFDMIAAKIGENGYMIIFLVLLGSLVVVVTRSGGSNAYGQWAGKRIKNKVSAKLATFLLGLMIFVDDGFNCLTVGTVMRPITDKCKVSREKLAYLLDATAAPVCIIAPISSWAVAVASEVEEAGGLNAFIRTIPYNLYAILTIVMVFFLSITDFDFGPMKKAEENQSIEDMKAQKEDAGVKNGTVPDLVVPILTLIVCSILGMAYVGGYFEGRSFAEAIGENPTAGLTLGTFAALLIAMVMYVPRKLMGLREFMAGVVDGIKTMIPALLILILAWALGGVCREMIGPG